MHSPQPLRDCSSEAKELACAVCFCGLRVTQNPCIWSLEFRVLGFFEFRIPGMELLRFRLQSVEFGVLGFRVLGIRF